MMMMRDWRSLVVIVGLGLAAFWVEPARGQGLESVRSAYEAQVKKIDDAYEQSLAPLRERYLAKVKALAMQLRRPEEKRMLDEEMARFDTERTVPETPPPGQHRKIQEAQAAYARSVQRLAGQRDTRLKPMARAYDRQLRELLRAEEAAGGADAVKEVKEALTDHGTLMYGLGLVDERAMVLLLVNTHNNNWGDRGSRMVTVTLMSGSEKVWEKAGVVMAWSKTREPTTALVLPDVSFDRLRVTVTEREGVSAGFSEIKVMLRGKNLAFKCPVKVSAAHKLTPATKLVDGNESSRGATLNDMGHFMFPDKGNGWVELDLSAVLPQKSSLRSAAGAAAAGPAAPAGGGAPVVLPE